MIYRNIYTNDTECYYFRIKDFGDIDYQLNRGHIYLDILVSPQIIGQYKHTN